MVSCPGGNYGRVGVKKKAHSVLSSVLGVVVAQVRHKVGRALLGELAAAMALQVGTPGCQ